MSEHMPTKPYFILDAERRTGLEAEQANLVKVVDDPKSDWVTKERAAARLSEVRRLLKTDELARRQAQQPGQRAVEREVQHVGQQRAEQQGQDGVEPIHRLVCAPGYRAISEPGQGILIEKVK